MPFVSIRIIAGRSPETKAKIAEGTVKVIAAPTGLPADAIWVVFEDITTEDWFVGPKSVAAIRASPSR